MKIKFNSLGVVTETITNDEALRQGNVGNHLQAFFEGKNNVNYTATISFTRSDGATITEIPMTPNASDTTRFDYTFDDAWFFAKDGETTCSVKLINAANVAEVNGQITFSIEETDFSDDDPQITVTQYNALLSLIASKLNKQNGIITVDSVSDIVISEYQEGQLFFAKDTKILYELKNNNLVIFVNPLLSNSIGIVIKDNAGSGTLTDDEILEVLKPYCLFIRTSSTGSDTYVKDTNTISQYRFFYKRRNISNTSTYNEYSTIFDYQVIVDITNKNFNVSTGQTYIYSKDQAEKKFAIKSGNNTFTSDNTFSGNPPLINQVIGDDANPKVATNKEYVDRKVENIEARSDVVDVVGNYSDLQSYDTSTLTNNDVVKVLSDSTHNNETTYYRWIITNNVGAWSYVGRDNVYSIEEVNSLLSDKQDKLVAGSNITIDPNDKTISATNTTYTAGSGLDLTGTVFSIDTSVVAMKSDLNGLFKNATYSVSGDNANFTFTKNNNESVSVNIPLATTTDAGLMSPSDVQAINILNGKVAALEGVAHRLRYTSDANPTATDILNFVVASGYTNPNEYYGIQVVVNATNHVWQWFDNIPAFVDVGLLNVTKFTNSSEGSILGSTDLGKIYAESDGTGSLNGYDKLNNNVAPQYSASNTYAVGDLVIYNGDLYKCSTAISVAEAWDSTHWTQTSIDSSMLRTSGLYGKFVRIMNAPSSTTLTDEEIGQIQEGVFINGTFLGYKNPILLPANINYPGSNLYFGFLIGNTYSTPYYNVFSIETYKIENKKISRGARIISYNGAGDNQLFGKMVPRYPSDITKQYKIIQQVGGTLAWATELYGEAVTDSSITELTYESISVIALSSNTTFTLKTPQTNCIPEYKAIISNSAISDITITLTGVSKVQTNDNALTIVEGTDSTITIPTGVELEINIFNGHCIAYNWEA